MMKVDRVTSPEEVAHIMAIDDPRLEKQVLNKLKCSKVEWVQLLNMYIQDQDRMGMWATKESGKINAYIVAFNAVTPPISRSVIILYQSYFGMKDDDGALMLGKALEEVKEWARDKGADNITIQTDKPRINRKFFGFKEDPGVPMVLPL